MEKQLLLSVPSPCVEKWSGFTSSSDGRVCATCCKVVVDFTNMSENEVVNFITQKTGKVCGRFRTEQLKPYSQSPTANIQPGWHLLRASMLILLVVLANNPGFSNPLAMKANSEINRYQEQSKNENSFVKDFTVRGMVKSEEDMSPLPGVNIYLKGTEVGTVSDGDGKFEFPRKLKAGDVLVFSFIGLKTQEYVVTSDVQEQIQVSMAMSADIMMGELVVDNVYTKQPSSVQKWWSKVKGVF
jgi:hypothetical protein